MNDNVLKYCEGYIDEIKNVVYSIRVDLLNGVIITYKHNIKKIEGNYIYLEDGFGINIYDLCKPIMFHDIVSQDYIVFYSLVDNDYFLRKKIKDGLNCKLGDLFSYIEHLKSEVTKMGVKHNSIINIINYPTINKSYI